MAQNDNILQRLGKLFQSNIVIRKDDEGQLQVKDLDYSQTSLTSNFVDRYSKLITNTFGSQYSARQNRRNAYDIQRKELFRDYELMDSDPIISSALDIYSDESNVTNVEGDILQIKSDNPKVAKILMAEYISVIIANTILNDHAMR